MKKILKIFSFFILGVILLIVIVLFSLKAGENKIAGIALEKVSQTIKAPVKIDHISLVWLRKFPFATLQLDGVLLGSEQDSISVNFPHNNDTIVYISQVFLSLKTKALFNNEIDIFKIEVNGLELNYKIYKDSTTNIDFLLDTTAVEDSTMAEDSTSAPINLSVRKFSLNDVTINYFDSSTMTNARVHIPLLELKARIKDNEYTGDLKGNIELDHCALEGTNLYQMQKTAIDFKLNYNNGSLKIDKLDIETDGAKLNMAGNVIIGDTITSHLQIEGTNIMMGELIKYAPDEMLKEYGLNEVAGELVFTANIDGIYTETQLPKVDAEIHFKNGKIITTDYPALSKIKFSGKVTNGELRNNKTTSAVFDQFYFETPKSKFDFAFSVSDIDHLNYQLKTKMNIDLDDFKSFIPDSTVKSIKGKINLDLFTKGILPDSIGDDFTDYVLANTRLSADLIDFNINVDDTLLVNDLSANMTYLPNNFMLKNLKVKVPEYQVELINTSFDLGFIGSLNKTSSLNLDIRSYHIEMGTNIFKGNARIKNLDHPTFNINTNIFLNLAELKVFVPDTVLTRLDGYFTAGIQSHGTINLDSISDQTMPIVFENSTIKMGMQRINIEMPDTLIKVHNFSGAFAMKDDTILINDLGGNVSGFDFLIDSTKIWNVYKTFIQGRKDVDLIVQTKISLGTIDYSKIEALMLSTDSTTVDSAINTQTGGYETAKSDFAKQDTLVALLPDFAALGLPHFLIRGKLEADQVIYEKNVLDDISLLFRFADSLYVIDQFKLKTCDGMVNSSFKLDARRNWYQPVIDIKNTIIGLNVRTLLECNDNFGDTLLTYDKANGILTSDLNVRVFMIGDSVPTEKIRVKGDLKLEDGRLYHYPPLVELSNSMKMLGGLKELDELDFYTLKTSIFMFKDKVYFPKTDVVTSSLDFTAFGMQETGNMDNYEYHMVLHLGDVLTGKSEKLLKAQAKQNKKDGGTVDRKGLNLVALNNQKDSKYWFDNETIKKKFSNNLNIQQGFLNLLFNPLLVNFSTDIDRTVRNKEILEKYGKTEN